MQKHDTPRSKFSTHYVSILIRFLGNDNYADVFAGLSIPSQTLINGTITKEGYGLSGDY